MEGILADEAIQQELDTLTGIITATVPVEEIYLFGSYAYGTPHKDSDLDICVVVPDSVTEHKHPLDIGIDIRSKFRNNLKFPTDIIVKRSTSFAKDRNGPTMYRTISQEGVPIYG